MQLTISKPSDITTVTRSAFIDFVRRAGEVNVATLPALVDEAIAIVTIYEGEALIGTAALKRPASDYRSGIFKKAGLEALVAAHPLELGWVHVHSDHEGKGHGYRLVEAALQKAANSGVYATTKNDTMRRMLPKFSFAKVGVDYPSALKPDENLSLFTRAQT